MPVDPFSIFKPVYVDMMSHRPYMSLHIDLPISHSVSPSTIDLSADLFADTCIDLFMSFFDISICRRSVYRSVYLFVDLSVFSQSICL